MRWKIIYKPIIEGGRKMKFCKKMFDGGKDSTVTGYFLIEIKSLFSIVLLKFNKGSRENYHSHAFNALTWFLYGDLVEYNLSKPNYKYKGKLIPKITKKSDIHKVFANKNSYAISLRGPWDDYWQEYNPMSNKYITLTHGRKIVGESTL